MYWLSVASSCQNKKKNLHHVLETTCCLTGLLLIVCQSFSLLIHGLSLSWSLRYDAKSRDKSCPGGRSGQKWSTLEGTAGIVPLFESERPTVTQWLLSSQQVSLSELVNVALFLVWHLWKRWKFWRMILVLLEKKTFSNNCLLGYQNFLINVFCTHGVVCELEGITPSMRYLARFSPHVMTSTCDSIIYRFIVRVGLFFQNRAVNNVFSWADSVNGKVLPVTTALQHCQWDFY